MKSFFLFLSGILISISVKAQSPIPAFEWAVHLKGKGATIIVPKGLELDSEGNIYTIGSISSSNNTFNNVDFASGPNSKISPMGSPEYFAKYDPDGNLIWVKSSAIGSMHVKDFAIDTENNLIVHGYFNGETDFMIGTSDSLITASGNESFTAKYSSDGELIWVHYTESTSSLVGGNIAIDNSGNTYQYGYFGYPGDGIFDFNPNGTGGVFTNTSPNQGDKYILKLDESGGFLWLKQFPATTNPTFSFQQIKVDPMDNFIYLTGRVVGTSDFDPSPDSDAIVESEGGDSFIAKYTQDGEFIWVKTIVTNDLVIILDFDIQSDGSLVTSGYFKGTTDFDPSALEHSITSTNATDYFFARYTPDGELIQAHSIYNEGPGSSPVFAIPSFEIGSDDAIYIEGYLEGSADFDLGEGVQEYTTTNSFGSSRKHFYAKYDNNLNIQWFTRVNENQFSDQMRFGGFAIDSEQSLISTARFAGSLQFPGYTLQPNFSSAWDDVAIIKFKQCEYSIELDESHCEQHIWNNQTINESGVYTQSFFSSLGCDSVVTKNLTIYNSSSSDTTVAACSSYYWQLAGEEYFNSGSFVTTITNVNGCDSVVTLNLSLQDEIATISQASCGSYYWSETDSLYDESGTYSILYENVAGCDSLIILELEIFDDVTNEIEESSCDEYFWPTANTSYFNSGTYTHTLSTINACDSVVILNLTILESTVDTVFEQACSAYTWPQNGITYESSGIYEFITANAVGCDSIIQLDLTIQNSEIIEEVTSCGEYFWAVNETTYESSGTYFASYTDQFGCDSIHELNLEITEVDTMVVVTGATLVAQAESGQFQWLDCNNEFAEIAGADANVFNPAENGSYAVSITVNGCQDTSACYLITTVGINENVPDILGITIYPNPTMGNVVVESSTQDMKTLKVECYDILGKRVDLLNTTNENSFIIPGAPGIYILKIHGEGNKQGHFKVVKQ